MRAKLKRKKTIDHCGDWPSPCFVFYCQCCSLLFFCPPSLTLCLVMRTSTPHPPDSPTHRHTRAHTLVGCVVD